MDPAEFSLIVLIGLFLLLIYKYYTSPQRKVWKIVHATRKLTKTIKRLEHDPRVTPTEVLFIIGEMESKVNEVKNYAERYVIQTTDNTLLQALEVLKKETETLSQQLQTVRSRALAK